MEKLWAAIKWIFRGSNQSVREDFLATATVNRVDFSEVVKEWKVLLRQLRQELNQVKREMKDVLADKESCLKRQTQLEKRIAKLEGMMKDV